MTKRFIKPVRYDPTGVTGQKAVEIRREHNYSAFVVLSN